MADDDTQTDSAIPRELRRFITENIGSLGHLETLLLLWRTPERRWSPGAIAAELRSSKTAAELQLTSLCSRNLVEQNQGDYQFSRDPVLSASVAELAKAFQVRPVAITTLIYSKSSGVAEAFAEAFRVGKKDGPKDG